MFHDAFVPFSTGDQNTPNETPYLPQPVSRDMHYRHPVYENWGGGRISGSVTVTGGTPIRASVRCYDRASGKLVRDTMSSDVDGSYQFKNLLKLREYYVCAIHPTRAYNIESADAVTPE